MGVPGLFLWLIKKYDLNNIIIKKESINNFDNLFIDTNCLLHPQCFKVLDNFNKNDIKLLENTMIKECIKYIEYLINYIKPKKLLYIAIDGVAPFAKIDQQRSRRFMSSKKTYQIKKLKQKWGIEDNKLNWTNASITPGTIFMDKLDKEIKKWITEKRNHIDYQIIYSSCYIPSEGEHKILQYIKSNNIYNNYVIYGLDADLIFLSLASFKDQIYLLRESNIVDKKNKEILSLVSINEIKNILNEFKLQINNEFIDDRIITDFIFMCFFIGNDFLPKIQSVDIYAKNELINGLDLLIYCYCKTFNIYNEYLLEISNKINLNTDIFINFLDNLIIFENDYFIKRYNIKKNKFKYYEKIDSYEKDLKRIENLNFKINDEIKLGYDDEESWKFRYYKYHFKLYNNELEIIEESCYEYFKGLIWNSYYYFLSCPSWKWNYKFSSSPFLSDLRKYIKNFNFDIKFKLEQPLKPLEQLMCVLPPQYAFLLPKNLSFYLLNDKSYIIYLYPKKFDVDMIDQTKDWACKPIIPKIDTKILNFVNFKNLDNLSIMRIE